MCNVGGDDFQQVEESALAIAYLSPDESEMEIVYFTQELNVENVN